MGNLSSLINRFNLVKQIPIFEKLNWFEKQKIARKVIVEEHKKGDLISKEGDPPDFFFCLVSGRLQAYTMSSSGVKENIDFIHRGMHFGIISVLTGENHSMSFEAINDSVIIKIPADEFQAILQAMPHLGVELSQHLSRRIRRKVKGTKSIFESTVISVYSPVKGSGSSTYAANLAMSLQAETGKKVVLVSIDSNRNGKSSSVSTPDQASPRWKIAPVRLNEIIDDHEKILQRVDKGGLKIDLLHTTFDPEDQTLIGAIGSFISAFVGDYHYVVVDLPNQMDAVILEAMKQSDMMHLISTDRKKDLETIRRVIDRLEITLKENFRVDQVRVIVRLLHAQIFLSYEEINNYIDYHIYSALPAINQMDLTEKVESEQLSFMRSQGKSEYSRAVTRIARQIGGVSVGLVLGGGAALGVAHIGVIRVLEEEEIPIDIVVGSSMGALIGALWAIGKNSDELEAVAGEFRNRLAMLKLVDPPFLPVSGLIRGRAIYRWLKKQYGSRTFYNVRAPLKIVSYDLVRREELVIDSGLIVDAVRQSVAIPGVIKPIIKKDRLIVDGGVLNPLPTNVMTSRGIKKIIAVNVLQSPEHVSEGFDIIQHQQKKDAEVSFFKSPWHYIKYRVGRAFVKPFDPNISDIILQTLQATEYIIAEQNAQQADVVIHPDLVGFKWFELNRVDELIKRGEEAARNQLAEIKALITES